MKTEAQDIEMLARAILTEAREEADQLKADAQEKADAIRKRAQEQAEAERKAILDRAHEDAERLRGQSVATAQLKARSTRLTHREQLLERVFEAVKEKLTDVRNRGGASCAAAAATARNRPTHVNRSARRVRREAFAPPVRQSLR